MTKIVYQIVEHDGGWAYEVDGVYSETYRSHDRRGGGEFARRANSGCRTRRTGISTRIAQGRWHEEVAAGDDRPETDVEG